MSKVLIVEDNPDIASMYVSVFAEHQTVVLDDVPQVLNFLNANRPDLVIMDFHLPGGNGNDVISHIRRQSALAGVPILGISVDDTWRAEAMKHGASAFMTKPIDIRQLINVSRLLLSSPKRIAAPRLQPEAVLSQYIAAYQAVYRRTPNCRWTGYQYEIDQQPCDQAWLLSETERLRSVASQPSSPRSALLRLIDKIRKI